MTKALVVSTASSHCSPSATICQHPSSWPPAHLRQVHGWVGRGGAQHDGRGGVVVAGPPDLGEEQRAGTGRDTSLIHAPGACHVCLTRCVPRVRWPALQAHSAHLGRTSPPAVCLPPSHRQPCPRASQSPYANWVASTVGATAPQGTAPVIPTPHLEVRVFERHPVEGHGVGRLLHAAQLDERVVLVLGRKGRRRLAGKPAAGRGAATVGARLRVKPASLVLMLVALTGQRLSRPAESCKPWPRLATFCWPTQ